RDATPVWIPRRRACILQCGLGRSDREPGNPWYAAPNPHTGRQPGAPEGSWNRQHRARIGARRTDTHGATLMEVLILAAVLFLSLIMIPFGMPGTLVMFAAALCYKLLVPAGGIGWASVVIVGILMAIAEGLEWTLAARFTKKYGGSRRAGWGAILGGMVGAIMGVAIPIVGSSV